jgi:uncharacterized DUF497 family protein
VDCKWNDWNISHIAEHGVSPQEAEFVIAQARAPFPKYVGDGRHLVRGQTADGYYLQVAFTYDKYDGRIYVIHARPLTDREKSQFKRRRRP